MLIIVAQTNNSGNRGCKVKSCTTNVLNTDINNLHVYIRILAI